MTNEMDLIGELKGAEPLRPDAYQRARAVLRAAMAEPGTVQVLGTTSRAGTTMETVPVQGEGFTPAVQRRRKIGAAGRVGIGAGAGVAAAAAAIALVVGSLSTGGAVKAPGAAAARTATVGAPAAGSPLMALAADIKANPRPAGDAWLVISSVVQGTQVESLQYSLYTDTGALYRGLSMNDLKHVVARNQESRFQGRLETAYYAPVLKAAIFAATSSPAQGRIAMLKAFGDPLAGLSSPAAQKEAWDKLQAAAQVIQKKGGFTYSQTYSQQAFQVLPGQKPQPYSPQAFQSYEDNMLWNSAVGALVGGDGNTLVRQGVLRSLSTISKVSVAHSVTKGEATLTITAGAGLQRPILPLGVISRGKEVLTIDAKTGMLVKDVPAIPPGETPTFYYSYQSSRVTTAHL
jgi:hypothetical protein